MSNDASDVIYGPTAGGYTINGASLASGGLLIGRGDGNTLIAGTQPTIEYAPGNNETFDGGNITEPMTSNYGIPPNSVINTYDVLIGAPLDPSAETTPSTGTDTFNAGTTNNVMIGGSGTNIFNIPTAYSGYENLPVNVVWGDGGTSTYNFTSGELVAIVYMTDPTVAALSDISISELEASIDQPGSLYQGANYDGLTVIINPTANDTITLNGIKLTGASYGTIGSLEDETFVGYEAKDIYYQADQPGWLTASQIGPNPIVLQDALPELETEGGISIGGFVNGDFGITLSGDGPALTGGDYPGPQAAPAAFFSDTQKQYVTPVANAANSGGAGIGSVPVSGGGSGSGSSSGGTGSGSSGSGTGGSSGGSGSGSSGSGDLPFGGAGNSPHGSYANNAALGWQYGSQDPLVLDVSGKGLDLTADGAGAPYFAWTSADVSEQTGWIGAGSGFLAEEPAGGGPITSADLIDSFTQLAALDSNGDGVIDASDPAFATLVVWQDTNANGLDDAGEVETLAQLGVKSINLATHASGTVIAGNTVEATAVVTLDDGTTRTLGAVAFVDSTTYTVYNGSGAISAAAAALPQIQGYGRIIDLRQAATADATLLAEVNTLTSADPSDIGAFDADLRAVLDEWAGVASVATTGRGTVFNGQELGYLEALIGQPYIDGHGVTDPQSLANQGPPLAKAWDEAFAGIKARFLVQEANTPLANAFTLDQAADGFGYNPRYQSRFGRAA